LAGLGIGLDYRKQVRNSGDTIPGSMTLAEGYLVSFRELGIVSPESPQITCFMSIVDDAKKFIDLASEGLTVELEQQLIALKERELELQEENYALRELLKTLQDKIAIRDRLYYCEDGVYRLEGQDPYCQLCYDDLGKLYRLYELSVPLPTGYDDEFFTYQCHKCKNNYIRQILIPNW
jgi:hypothetical protein